MSNGSLMPVPTPSKGDLTQDTVSGGRDLVEVAFVDTASPQYKRPFIVGDTAVQKYAADYLGAGAELVVEHAMEAAKAYEVYKLSPFLEPIIDAIVANVYAAGYSLKSILDLDRPASRDLIRGYISYNKMHTGLAADLDASVTVTDEELEQTIEWMRTRMRNEQTFLDAFFTNCCPDMSYQQLTTLTGQDIEVMGTGYWEVLRGLDNRPQRLLWAPGWSIWARPQEETLYATTELQKISPLKWVWGTQFKRFRSYVQLDSTGTIVARYKQFGDPRCLSRKTGKYYPNLATMLQQSDEYYEDSDKNLIPAQPATEILSFPLLSCCSYTYGKNKITGIYPALAGARELDEYNRYVITDQSVPQMFVFVAGGRGVSKTAQERLAEQIKQNKKEGRRGIYIVHALSDKSMGGAANTAPTMHIEKTKSEQHTDALGLEYKKDAYDTTRRMYRMPKVALGDEEGTNRATALTMRRLTETEVYDPRRDMFGDRINTTIIRDLGVFLTQYKVRSRAPKEPNELAEIIKTLSTAGVITPDEGRELISDVFNKDFKDLIGAWSQIPQATLTALLQTKNTITAAAVMGEEGKLVQNLQESFMASVQQETTNATGTAS